MTRIFSILLKHRGLKLRDENRDSIGMFARSLGVGADIWKSIPCLRSEPLRMGALCFHLLDSSCTMIPCLRSEHLRIVALCFELRSFMDQSVSPIWASQNRCLVPPLTTSLHAASRSVYVVTWKKWGPDHWRWVSEFTQVKSSSSAFTLQARSS